MNKALEAAARALGAETMNCLPSEVDPIEWRDQARAAIIAYLRNVEVSEGMLAAAFWYVIVPKRFKAMTTAHANELDGNGTL